MLFGIASANQGKIREFKTLLKSIKNLDIVSMRDYPNYTPPEETGTTFEENAIIKALDFSKFIKGYVLADDSGLVVPALNGDPGVYSARYAGATASDTENRSKLLQHLNQIAEKDRHAYFECCLAVAGPQGVKKITHGYCEGYLILEERGRNGFGYDSLFIRHDYNKTFAELDDQVKNKISHRRKAFDKILPYIESLSMK
jgi:XTP/dITP diphosphohydrolase